MISPWCVSSWSSDLENCEVLIRYLLRAWLVRYVHAFADWWEQQIGGSSIEL